MFPLDAVGAKLRHQEMLRQAELARLAREATGARGDSLLKRMVTLLTRHRQRPAYRAEPTAMNPQPLADANSC